MVWNGCPARAATFSSSDDETIEQAWASREPYGAPQWETAAWITTYTAIRAGQLDVVTDSVEKITGRAPLSLSDVLAAQRVS